MNNSENYKILRSKLSHNRHEYFIKTFGITIIVAIILHIWLNSKELLTPEVSFIIILLALLGTAFYEKIITDNLPLYFVYTEEAFAIVPIKHKEKTTYDWFPKTYALPHKLPDGSIEITYHDEILKLKPTDWENFKEMELFFFGG